MVAGITVDFRAGLACPAIGQPAEDEHVVFFPAVRLVRMTSSEFKAMARHRRLTPRQLLNSILIAATRAAQDMLDREPAGAARRSKVCRLLLQGEVTAGRGKELVFQTLI